MGACLFGACVESVGGVIRTGGPGGSWSGCLRTGPCVGRLDGVRGGADAADAPDLVYQMPSLIRESPAVRSDRQFH